MDVLIVSAYRVCQEHANTEEHTLVYIKQYRVLLNVNISKHILVDLDRFITSWQNNHKGELSL